MYVPQTATERALDWVKAHKFACSIAGLAVLGAVGYGAYHFISAHEKLVSLRNRAAQRKKASNPPGDADRDIVSKYC